MQYHKSILMCILFVFAFNIYARSRSHPISCTSRTLMYIIFSMLIFCCCVALARSIFPFHCCARFVCIAQWAHSRQPYRWSSFIGFFFFLLLLASIHFLDIFSVLVSLLHTFIAHNYIFEYILRSTSFLFFYSLIL